MNVHPAAIREHPFQDEFNEKLVSETCEEDTDQNPVVSTSEFVYKAIDLVKINEEGVKHAAKHIRQRFLAESYTPRTWRTHPLHLCPSDPYDVADSKNRQVLDWIFLISALNFSFWSEKEGTPERYGVEWRCGWASNDRTIHTGYWSLVAALDRAIEANIPITDPAFYASGTACPDSLIENIFRRASQSTESIPLLSERIRIMREVGYILATSYGGSFQSFISEFQRRHDGDGTALDLVKTVIETFPSFRDEFDYKGTKICLWKRAQILVAETWAAFFPASSSAPHPIFPGKRGPVISELTMFADYRVPQILHHLRILSYPTSLIDKLTSGTHLPSGSQEELSLRAASIVAVERVREEILDIMRSEQESPTTTGTTTEISQGQKEESGDDARRILSDTAVSSVLIDFYLWDLAKKVETGVERIEGLETDVMAPIHRTRSIWY